LGAKPRYTWQDAVLRYLSEHESQKSISTTKDYLRYLDKHLRDLKLDEIDRAIVDSIRMAKKATGVKNGTVNRTLTVLRAILNAAKDWEWLDVVPSVKLIPDNVVRIRWITKEEVSRLLVELPEHLNAMTRFSLATGLRASNVTGLQWSQVDMKRRCAWIHADEAKGKKAIAVPLNDDALLVIREQIGKHLTHVFTYKGNPVSVANTKAWRNALKRADIKDFRFHDLRHTWASWHRMNGTPLDALKELGAWSDIEMVLRYAHLSSEHLNQYANNSLHGTNLAQSEKSNIVNIV
jgi:integrase